MVITLSVGALSFVNFIFDDSNSLEKFDVDSDGIGGTLDAFSKDPTEWADFDFDGIGSNADPDDDNDLILDENDETPVPISEVLTEKYLNQIQECSIIGLTRSPQMCFADFFEYLIKEGEPSQDVLDLAMSLSSMQVLNGCHVAVHRIGMASYRIDPNHMENVFDMPSFPCRGGYFHGSMATFFMDMRDQGFELSEFDDNCDELISSIFNYKICLHGVGHGLIAYHEGNLDAALTDCLAYEEKLSCSSGAMMGYAGQKIKNSSSLESEISEFCSKETMNFENFKRCSLQVGKMISYINNNDRWIVSQFCEKIQDPDGKFECYEGLLTAIRLSEYDRDKWILTFNLDSLT